MLQYNALRAGKYAFCDRLKVEKILDIKLLRILVTI